MNKYIVEFIGTFTLASIVGLSIAGIFPIATPILAGLILGMFVYTIGHISGAHINPAVTLGLLSIGKIKMQDATGYLIAQMLAGLTVMLTFSMLLNKTFSMNADFALATLIAEVLGMALFTFGIAAVVCGKVGKDMSGVVVGTSLFLGIAVSILLGANGALNPAVALGIGSFGISYIIGPILGSVIGFNLYKFISNEK